MSDPPTSGVAERRAPGVSGCSPAEARPPRCGAATAVEEARPSFETVAGGLAACQHGIVTRRQLLERGLAPGVIERRVRGGRLHPVHRGVYRVGPIASPFCLEMAACLACGPGAVLSDWSAAALWRALPEGLSKGSVHVTVRAGWPRRSGIAVHRRALPAEETTQRDGIPVTTPARTLLDLAPVVRPRTLERAMAEALARRITSEIELEALIARHAGRPGAHRLALALGGGGPRLTRSEAEERFLALVRQARLPRPESNAVVAGYEVDFHWRSEGVAVEIDGFAFHSSRRSFERDRSRDADLTAAGLLVLRFTWRQLAHEPLAVAARLGGILRQGTSRRI